MVVVRVNGDNTSDTTTRSELESSPGSSTRRDSAAKAVTSDRWGELGPPRKGTGRLNNDVECAFNTRRECDSPGREFKDVPEIHAYVNIANDPLKLTETHRHIFELRRRSRDDSIDSTDEALSSRIQSKFQGDYEFMSSPDSFSNSSSNRSSNTSSLAHWNYSPDSASLNSFSDRFVFGRAEGSKRCSQVSTASQDSRGSRQSWGRTRDSLDLSDAGSTSSNGRSSSENTYENTANLSQDPFLRRNRKMSLNVNGEDPPPPLPVRQCPPSSAPPKTPEVELIMPYKVVDLEELQRSLDDMEPYYIHNDSDSGDYNVYNDCLDTLSKSETTATRENQKRDSRPILPPKRRTLSYSLSEPVTPPASNGEVISERPTPLPRQSVIITDPDRSKQTSESDEETSSASTNQPALISGHLSRQKSLPVCRVVRSRRQSTSPHRTARPLRSAPPPPPSMLQNKSPSARPVSEMLPRGQHWNQYLPTTLKRSNTVSMLQSPSTTTPSEKYPANLNTVPISMPPSGVVSSSSSTLQTDQPKEESSKSGFSKSGVFFSKSKAFKKALTTLKKPVTKKQAKKELVIGPPTDFASLYQPKVVANYTDSERKTVSFLDREEVEDEWYHPNPDTENVDLGDEEVYHNFPISQADDNPDELLSPKKPPRRFTSPDLMHHDGYLQPSTSQWTKEQEEEISQNKLPELGPLPILPAELSSPETKDPPTAITNGDDCKNSRNKESPKPIIKTKPKVPRRPECLKPTFQKKPPTQVTHPNMGTTRSQTTQKSAKFSKERNFMVHARVSCRSRSCEALNVDDAQDAHLTSVNLAVLKDILLRWRNMLRKPKISLSGACWEDFEIVEGGSWPKVSEVHGSVLQPVQLKKSSLSLDSKKCESKFIAKIKSQTNPTNASKSCYDQDYSVCSIVEPHENVARVLAYFRGDIRPKLLGLANAPSQFHTTISITDQVPAMTCDEFVAKSVEFHNSDPYSYERTVCLLVLQCLIGLDHLHSAGYTHGHITLSNLFLIKHSDDLQLFLGNLGKSQPLPKERRLTESSKAKTEGASCPAGIRSDLTATCEVIFSMLHFLDSGDQNGNLVNISKCRTSPLFGFLEKVSMRLRNATTTLRQAIGLLRALLWGPFKIDEDRNLFSESRIKKWLERQRGEFVAKLAMDEALSRTVANENRKRFSMEELMLCEYLSVANSNSLMRTGKCWVFGT